MKGLGIRAGLVKSVANIASVLPLRPIVASMTRVRRLHRIGRYDRTEREESEMTRRTTEDHQKFGYALVTRDIRRLTAVIHRSEIGGDTRAMIEAALEQLEARVWVTMLHNPLTRTLINNQDEYSDGRPVTTTIGSEDGFATLVHCPDPADGTSGNQADELSEELWPY